MSAPIDDKPVTQKDVIRITLEALRAYRKHFSFDANMVEFGFTNPTNLTAYRKRREIETAIAQFEKENRRKV